MSKLIFYCSGGLGNRLNPMLNVKDIFKNDLYIVWPQTKRLMCDFHDIFENVNVKNIDLNTLTDVSNYHGSAGGLVASIYERDLNGNNDLFKLSKKFIPKPIKAFNQNISNDTVVFYNNFIGTINPEIVIENFKNLIPKKSITNTINTLISDLGISKDVIGIHARATDFTGEKVSNYYGMIDNELKINKDQKILVCSDDPEWELTIKNRYPDNIIIRKTKNNVYKLDTDRGYTNNVMTPLDAIIDGYVDMVLLSKTNFKYFNKNSSFGKLINIIKNG